MDKNEAVRTLRIASDAIDKFLLEWNYVPKDVMDTLNEASTLCWRLSNELDQVCCEPDINGGENCP